MLLIALLLLSVSLMANMFFIWVVAWTKRHSISCDELCPFSAYSILACTNIYGKKFAILLPSCTSVPEGAEPLLVYFPINSNLGVGNRVYTRYDKLVIDKGPYD